MATTVTFFSKFTEHELVRQPKVDKPVASGVGWITESKGVRYKFKPALDDETGLLVGRLDVKAGTEKMQDTQGWLHPDADTEKIRDAVEALRAHREFGRDFYQASTPAKVVRSRIRQSLAALDADGLAALLEEERSVNARQDLLGEIQDALDLVNEQIASLQASQAQVEAEKPKAKAKPKAPAAA